MEEAPPSEASMEKKEEAPPSEASMGKPSESEVSMAKMEELPHATFGYYLYLERYFWVRVIWRVIWRVI